MHKVIDNFLSKVEIAACIWSYFVTTKRLTKHKRSPSLAMGKSGN